MFRYILFTVGVFLSRLDTIQGQNILEGSMYNRSIVLGGQPSFDCFISAELTAGQKVEFHKVLEGENILLGGSESGVVNVSKHNVTGRYTLHIKEAGISDEGQYQCTLTRNNGNDQNTGFLIVSDPPRAADLYWPGGRSWAILGERQNLTCKSENSRPPATFRWFLDNVDITHLAINLAHNSSNSYGEAYSTLEVYPLMSDEGSVYKCMVDVPGGEGWFSLEQELTFSSASAVETSIALGCFMQFLALCV